MYLSASESEGCAPAYLGVVVKLCVRYRRWWWHCWHQYCWKWLLLVSINIWLAAFKHESLKKIRKMGESNFSHVTCVDLAPCWPAYSATSLLGTRLIDHNHKTQLIRAELCPVWRSNPNCTLTIKQEYLNYSTHYKACSRTPRSPLFRIMVTTNSPPCLLTSIT